MFLKKSVEKTKTHILYSEFFFETPSAYGIMWRMRIAYCISKAKNTLSECVILFAVQLQQWLNKSFSLLRYTDIIILTFPTMVFA